MCGKTSADLNFKVGKPHARRSTCSSCRGSNSQNAAFSQNFVVEWDRKICRWGVGSDSECLHNSRNLDGTGQNADLVQGNIKHFCNVLDKGHRVPQEQLSFFKKSAYVC